MVSTDGYVNRTSKFVQSMSTQDSNITIQYDGQSSSEEWINFKCILNGRGLCDSQQILAQKEYDSEDEQLEFTFNIRCALISLRIHKTCFNARLERFRNNRLIGPMLVVTQIRLTNKNMKIYRDCLTVDSSVAMFSRKPTPKSGVSKTGRKDIALFLMLSKDTTCRERLASLRSFSFLLLLDKGLQQEHEVLESYAELADSSVQCFPEHTEFREFKTGENIEAITCLQRNEVFGRSCIGDTSGLSQVVARGHTAQKMPSIAILHRDVCSTQLDSSHSRTIFQIGVAVLVRYKPIFNAWKDTTCRDDWPCEKFQFILLFNEFLQSLHMATIKDSNIAIQYDGQSSSENGSIQCFECRDCVSQQILAQKEYDSKMIQLELLLILDVLLIISSQLPKSLNTCKCHFPKAVPLAGCYYRGGVALTAHEARSSMKSVATKAMASGARTTRTPSGSGASVGPANTAPLPAHHELCAPRILHTSQTPHHASCTPRTLHTSLLHTTQHALHAPSIPRTLHTSHLPTTHHTHPAHHELCTPRSFTQRIMRSTHPAHHEPCTPRTFPPRIIRTLHTTSPAHHLTLHTSQPPHHEPCTPRTFTQRIMSSTHPAYHEPCTPRTFTQRIMRSTHPAHRESSTNREIFSTDHVQSLFANKLHVLKLRLHAPAGRSVLLRPQVVCRRGSTTSPPAALSEGAHQVHVRAPCSSPTQVGAARWLHTPPWCSLPRTGLAGGRAQDALRDQSGPRPPPQTSAACRMFERKQLSAIEFDSNEQPHNSSMSIFHVIWPMSHLIYPIGARSKSRPCITLCAEQGPNRTQRMEAFLEPGRGKSCTEKLASHRLRVVERRMLTGSVWARPPAKTSDCVSVGLARTTASTAMAHSTHSGDMAGRRWKEC
ncbi:Protein of unknown function [Gryllus bimaculatus]|nr:Protein of unknown function [Gryllus bimaculatus]